MGRNTISHVLLEAVTGMVQREATHQPVARDLCDDGRRGNRQHDTVAANHGLAIAGHSQPVAAVDKDMFRRIGERTHRARQRPQ